MFTKLVANDEAIAVGSPFAEEEVQFNLIHRISEDSDSLCFKTLDGKAIFAQTPGHNGWLWISQKVEDAGRKALIQRLVDYLKGADLPGITGEPESAEMFAKVFSEQYKIDMTMEAYHCPRVVKPVNVQGEIQKATIENIETVACYLAGFLKDAFGNPVEPTSQLPKAKNMIESGGLYLWMVDGRTVSMANIAHRSPRHARINAVFTPVEHRKKGYASALVAEICSILETEKLVPLLYADLKNPTSNKIYRNIGFLECGKIAEYTFISR